VPKVLRLLKLADYAPEYGDAAIQVWVNPPESVRRVRFDLLADFMRRGQEFKDGKKTQQVVEEYAAWQHAWKARWTTWLAQLWSQSPDPAQHWMPAELEELDAADPSLARWLTQQTLEMVDNPKKASMTA
jgi:hypothetical protein